MVATHETDCRSLAAHSLTRRRLLSAASAASLLSLTQFPARAFAADIELSDFIALSQKLTGRDDLAEDIARGMLNAFSAIGRDGDIADMIAGESNDELAGAIIAAWYSGKSPDPDALDVLTYTDALTWQAIEYTKPMAYCGGAMGYWADPPES